jgi:hypothetical protein
MLPTGCSKTATAGKDREHGLQTALVGKFFSQEFIQHVLSFSISLSAVNSHQKLLSGENQAFRSCFSGQCSIPVEAQIKEKVL